MGINGRAPELSLPGTLGNLVNRTISMSNKYFGGVVENKNVCEPVDDDLKKFILSVPAKVDAKMDKLRVADAMTEVFTVFKRCNKYIDETMPWALAKEEDKERPSCNCSLQLSRGYLHRRNSSEILYA